MMTSVTGEDCFEVARQQECAEPARPGQTTVTVQHRSFDHSDINQISTSRGELRGNEGRRANRKQETSVPVPGVIPGTVGEGLHGWLASHFS
ncbi:hypothetical protein AAFF_G00141530 [Aldrovandia affinis]|uniref:Uncharacterized protein n=1 Tax=Aldrovandia affinis TaxID=143900 RepID=A0AAD7TCH4_9TELE|nr:hypothetical protein AAFF_G00141530 [Aldrovandia affinis]